LYSLAALKNKEKQRNENKWKKKEGKRERTFD